MKKGISLIVLIITIIVMIILAGSIILTLSNSGIISQTQIGMFKNNVASYKDELSIYVANEILTNEDFDVNKFSSDCQFIKDYITSMSSEDAERFLIMQGQLVYISEGNLFNTDELKALKEIKIKPTTPIYVANLGIFDNTTDYTGQKIYINPTPELSETNFQYSFNSKSSFETSGDEGGEGRITEFTYTETGYEKFYQYMPVGRKFPAGMPITLNGKLLDQYDFEEIKYNCWLEIIINQTTDETVVHMILPENVPYTIIEGTIGSYSFNANELGKYASFTPYVLAP